jgi:hypothetical protein
MLNEIGMYGSTVIVCQTFMVASSIILCSLVEQSTQGKIGLLHA